MNKKGKVYLVGAGPGRPDLITVRGLELLKCADCVIYDKLANPALLNCTRQDAELLAVPKRKGPGSFTQEQINNLLVQKAGEGKTIVRLKGGDPYIFGRGTEEAAVLAEAGIDFEVVPGVTAALAASCYSGVALTDRNFASEVIFVTGHEAEGKQQPGIDWHLLAKFAGTIVFYMGIENLNTITRRFIENGMAPNTPAAVIADATMPTQKEAKATLATITEACEKNKIVPPALVFIGPTAVGDIRLDWLSKSPLFGKTVVVTRDAEGGPEFAAKLASRMADTIELPVTKIRTLTDSSDFIKMLARIHDYDWIVFTSRNGVDTFFAAITKLGKDARVFCKAQIAAIGVRTAETLASFGIKADFVPTAFTSKDLAKGLINFTNLRGKKILLLRSLIASDDLPQLLETAGTSIDTVHVYTHEKNLCDMKSLSERPIRWLTFASPFAATCFFEQVSPDFVNSLNAKVASIGPVTSKKFAELGVKVDIEAFEHTFDGLLAAMEEYELRTTK